MTRAAVAAVLCLSLSIAACRARNDAPADTGRKAAASRAASPVGALPLPGTGTLGTASADTFTFIVAGDNRPAKADSGQPPTPGLIFAVAQQVKPAFYAWTGDMIYGLDAADSATIAAQYTAFFTLAKSAGVPVFAAPGNHEMDVKVKHDTLLKETGSAAMEALYRLNVGLPAGAPVYQAFTYGNSRFILLNTEEVTPAGYAGSAGARVAGGKVNLDPGYVSPAQLAWVRQQLDSSAGAAHVFVFMHHPIRPLKRTMGLDSTSAASLVALFARYANVSFVFASHEHLFYNPQAGDTTSPPPRTDPAGVPPVYLVSGGAGAPLTGNAASGGFHHYLVARVTGARVVVQVVQLP